MLSGSQGSAHREQVRRRTLGLERVVDRVKVNGKRGLRYRGIQSEAAYTFEDTSIDHSNFLEMIILLGKYDVCFKERLTECIEKNKNLHQSGARGRGSLITLLSKNTVNTVIHTIQSIIQETMSSEIEQAGMFSVQIDTTWDITSQNQCSVIVRYVTNVIQERLVAVVKCEASTGQYFVQLLTDGVDKLQMHWQCYGWIIQYAGEI